MPRSHSRRHPLRPCIFRDTSSNVYFRQARPYPISPLLPLPPRWLPPPARQHSAHSPSCPHRDSSSDGYWRQTLPCPIFPRLPLPPRWCRTRTARLHSVHPPSRPPRHGSCCLFLRSTHTTHYPRCARHTLSATRRSCLPLRTPSQFPAVTRTARPQHIFHTTSNKMSRAEPHRVPPCCSTCGQSLISDKPRSNRSDNRPYKPLPDRYRW